MGMLHYLFVVVHENNKVLRGRKCRFNYLSFLISRVYSTIYFLLCVRIRNHQYIFFFLVTKKSYRLYAKEPNLFSGIPIWEQFVKYIIQIGFTNFIFVQLFLSFTNIYIGIELPEEEEK